MSHEQVASYPTADSVQAYFDEWVAFYQDYYLFPDIPVSFEYGFDSYKVSYCTVDAALPGQSTGEPTIATGMISVPRKAGPLSTVAYLHGTSVSFYDAPSNPNIFGELSEAGESFDGPPSNAVFAGSGFVYVAPDYLGLGDSSVPRHRYFHAASEASATVDLLAASQEVLDSLQIERDEKLFTFGFSQGGHSALALHRELQDTGVDVTATATVGAVFDVEQWLLSSLADGGAATCPSTSRTSCSPTTTSTTSTARRRRSSNRPTTRPSRACSTCATTSTTSPPRCLRPRKSSSTQTSSPS